MILKRKKENQSLLYSSWLPELGLLPHPWSITRLRSHCLTRVGSGEAGRVPSIEPFLNVYCLLCSGLDQPPQWDPGLQGLGNKYC